LGEILPAGWGFALGVELLRNFYQSAEAPKALRQVASGGACPRLRATFILLVAPFRRFFGGFLVEISRYCLVPLKAVPIPFGVEFPLRLSFMEAETLLIECIFA